MGAKEGLLKKADLRQPPERPRLVRFQSGLKNSYIVKGS
jgi:hypothetical protein